MVEVGIAGFISDFLFEFVDGAGRIDGFDIAAICADEIVVVSTGDQKSEVSSAFMKAKTADNSFASEFLEKAKNRCFVALLRQMTAGGDFG